MDCYKYQDEFSPIDGGVTYVETADGIVYRQITVNGEKYLMSNIRYPKWGLMMADQKLDLDNVDQVYRITNDEFETIWNAHLIYHQAQWLKTKERYQRGIPVTGAIQIFYPQGVIVGLDEDSLGLADYAECRATAKPEWMYPGYRVTASVADYDELNYWVVLGKPCVHGELLQDYCANR